MLLAAACTCAEGPRIFERGWCHRCGRLLDPVMETDGAIDVWIRLDAAVERERMMLRASARGRGLSLAEYAAELEEALGAGSAVAAAA